MQRFNTAEVMGLPQLSEYIEEVNQVLLEATADQQDPRIEALIKRGGKMLRPSLVIATVLGEGRQIDRSIILGAAAVELTHLGSLLIDDVMDNAPTRRGVVSLNADGDFGLATLKGQRLLEVSNKLALQASYETSRLLTDARLSLITGQEKETVSRFKTDRSVAEYHEAIRGKTAAMFAVSCRIGGSLAGLNNSKLDALEEYGKQFGMGFQIKDDILDFTADPETTGKPVGNDVKEGVYTLPLILALRNAANGQLRASLKARKADGREVGKLLEASGYIQKAREAAQAHGQAAIHAIEDLQGYDSQPLVRLAQHYLA